MFRHLLLGRQRVRHSVVSYANALGRSLYTLNKQEAGEAQQWLEKFRSQSLQRSDVELTFARSSGPGGCVLTILAFTFSSHIIVHGSILDIYSSVRM